jgi:hypothetical protein
MQWRFSFCEDQMISELTKLEAIYPKNARIAYGKKGIKKILFIISDYKAKEADNTTSKCDDLRQIQMIVL